MTREQRYAIEALLQKTMSLREIAEVIGVTLKKGPKTSDSLREVDKENNYNVNVFLGRHIVNESFLLLFLWLKEKGKE